MCDILESLKDIKSEPVSSSFKNYKKIPNVLKKISKILDENNNTVISKYNKKRIIKVLQILN